MRGGGQGFFMQNKGFAICMLGCVWFGGLVTCISSAPLARHPPPECQVHSPKP